MGEFIGPLKDFSAIELGVIAARAAMERTKVDPAWIDHVVFGNVMQTSGDALYGARHVGLKAGVPIEVPALTVNRLCGSGLQAAISGAQLIQLGEARIALTGGMESMTQAPHVIRGMRTGLRMNHAKLEDTLWEALLDTHCGCSMAITAENCAAKYGIIARGAGCLRAAQPAARVTRVGRRPSRRGSRARRHRVAEGQDDVRAGRSSASRHDASKASRSCRPRSRRTAASPPATPAGSSTAAPRS